LNYWLFLVEGVVQLEGAIFNVANVPIIVVVAVVVD